MDQHSLQDRAGRGGAGAGGATARGGSRTWHPDRLDLAGARQPDEVAGPLVDFALDPNLDAALYGELVHVGADEVSPVQGTAMRTGSIVPWQ